MSGRVGKENKPPSYVFRKRPLNDRKRMESAIIIARGSVKMLIKTG